VRRWILAAALLLPAILVSTAAAFAQAEGETRLLRFPDIDKDKIVFVYGGDLWLVGAEGGTARRLTADPGEELFPKFSPDGRQIAFTGQYGGNRQVFVMSVDGGAPRQLTFHNDIGDLPPRGGTDNQVLGWTPDGKNILFNSHRTPWSERIARPYMIAAGGGMEVPLPIPEGSAGVLSPDGTKLVYSPVMNEYRGWKRYHGGRASDLWIYDLARNTAERLTDYDGNDFMPAWIGNTIYFISDREGGILNLFSLDPASHDFPRKTRKVTDHKDWDALWPSGDDRRIVYECGGFLWLFDPAAGQSRKVPIHVAGDLAHTLPYFKNVKSDIHSMALSPTGKRALFGARGDVFTVPAAKGEIRNLTRSPGVREIDPAWSPDGRWIAYLSDRTGEYEVWARQSDGSGEERRVTTGGTIWRFPPLWSPDSKKIAFSDKDERLIWVDVASGKATEADRETRSDLTDYTWSPDSRWLAYTKIGPSKLASVWVYSLDKGKAWQLTSDLTNEAEPVFDPQGRYLYFLSNRDFNLTFSSFEFDYVYTNPTRVYVALLAKDGPALFLPESDEESIPEETKGSKPGGAQKLEPAAKTARKAAPAKEAPEAEPKKAAEGTADAHDANTPDKAEAPTKPVKIDVDGFELRVRAIPGPSGDYRNLAAGPDAVYYVTGAGTEAQLKMYDLKEQKESVILPGVGNYELSADGKKILYNQGETYGIVDAKADQKVGDGALSLDRMELQIDPRAEWNELYVDAWRSLRDFFYDPAMHGLDWQAIRAKYAQLVPFLASRSDLDFILTEMGNELSAGHIYVERGDEPGPKRVENGLLGAEIEAHPSGVFRIAKIFPGENWNPDFRSPLTEPGVHVAAGDYILAVDGESTQGVDNFYRLLQNRAEGVVTLLVNSAPSAQGAHEERVRPISSEQNLRYLDWVQATRARVDKASGGRIGYLHLPDTAVKGNRELFKYFYPQATKDALILDDRYNGGGFIPDRMIALLSRPLLNYWAQRNVEPLTTPSFYHNGPKAALINGQAGSGGDAFPFYFREMKLGPLIGTRTWGGLAGLNFTPPLLDGGSLSAPSFRFYTTEGQWAVENEGVAPDVEVIDRPDEVAKGHDPSLEKAIAYLLEELRKNPPKKVPVPTPPKGGAPR
jgi:tricorn protease